MATTTTEVFFFTFLRLSPSPPLTISVSCAHRRRLVSSQSSFRALTVAAPNRHKPPWLIIVAHIVVSSLTIVHSLDNHSLIHSLSSLSCSLPHFFSGFSVEEGACGYDDDDDDEQQWPNETEMVAEVRQRVSNMAGVTTIEVPINTLKSSTEDQENQDKSAAPSLLSIQGTALMSIAVGFVVVAMI
ncbi:uncharacterized protein DS421_16g557710 [Arachis hypogaea]|nr:uncharacterized protein DS421_16g557710 [Arachis hypogaea]